MPQGQITLSGIQSIGVQPLTYIWKDGTGSEIGYSLEQIVSVADTYSLTISDGVSTHTAYYLVSEDFSKPIASIIPNPNTQELTLGTTSITLQGNPDTGPYSYVWRNEAYVLLTNNVDLVVTIPGVYRFYVEDTNTGCVGSTTINITVDDTPPIATISGPSTQYITCEELSDYRV